MRLQYLLMQVAVPAPGRVLASCPPIRFSFVDCATGAGFPNGMRFDWFSRTQTVDSGRDGWSARPLRATPTRVVGLLSAPRRNDSSLSIIQELAMIVGTEMLVEFVVRLAWRSCQHLSDQLIPSRRCNGCCVCCHLASSWQ